MKVAFSMHRTLAGNPPATNYEKQMGDLTAELWKFADWAFGEEGLACLRVIVFGDCAYGRRFSESNVLLCRTPREHRSVTDLSFCRLPDG